nr:HAD-IB family hydrolase [uncultured Dethiosulfovibrio sp.]
MGIALFDFDGTLIEGDSCFLFHRKVFGLPKVLSAALKASLLHGLSQDRRHRMKQVFLSELWAGVSRDELRSHCEDFVPDLDLAMRPGAMDRLSWHLARGDQVVLVSASVSDWLEPWCRSHGVNSLIATELEDIGGILTGRIKGRNCRGPEKVRRIKKAFQSLPEPVFVYGDSEGDREMFTLAERSRRFYRPFRK